MKKFEYKYLASPVFGNIEKELNKLGQEGWEAVAMASLSVNKHYVLLKREV